MGRTPTSAVRQHRVHRRPRAGTADRRRDLVLLDGLHDVFVVESWMQCGTAVLVLRGEIAPLAVDGCRAAVDRILHARPADAVVDLGAARSRGQSWAVLEAMRRYLQRHGVRTCLVAVPRAVAAELAAHDVAHGFSYGPTLQSALDASARRAHLSSGRHDRAGVLRPVPAPGQ